MVAPCALLRRHWRNRRTLVREVSAFGIVGGACFGLDLLVFQLLYAQTDVGAVAAKLGSTIVSTTVAYLAHRQWSFRHRAGTGTRREFLVFIIINGVTLVLGVAVVAFVRHPLDQDSALVLQLANVGSIAAGTVIRFVSYRRWVFPAGGRPSSPARDATPTSVAHRR